MKRSTEIRQALEKIRSRNRKGKLYPEKVVEAATDSDNPLHRCFCWDNSKAAHEYRLWQARQLIVSVRISFDDKAESICQAYVSLKPDRVGGGYRSMGDVLSSPQLHAEMLRTALEELNAFQDRYQRFKELKPVFRATRRVRRLAKAH